MCVLSRRKKGHDVSGDPKGKNWVAGWGIPELSSKKNKTVLYKWCVLRFQVWCLCQLQSAYYLFFFFFFFCCLVLNPPTPSLTLHFIFIWPGQCIKSHNSSSRTSSYVGMNELLVSTIVLAHITLVWMNYLCCWRWWHCGRLAIIIGGHIWATAKQHNH